MKKNTAFLLLLLAFISLTAYSQTGSDKTIGSTQNTKYIYCELVQKDIFIITETRTTMFLNFGSKSTYQNQLEESSYIRLQKDGMHALSYMSEKDWELIDKNTREINSGIETVYLFRKKTH